MTKRFLNTVVAGILYFLPLAATVWATTGSSQRGCSASTSARPTSRPGPAPDPDPTSAGGAGAASTSRAT